jgi:putative membrane protein
MNIPQEDREKVNLSIEQAERNTTGEIVVKIVKKSHVYHTANYRCGIVFSLIMVFVLTLTPLPHQNPMWIIAIQIPAFNIGLFLAMIPSLKRFFTTQAEMNYEVHRRSLESFHQHDLHSTADRTGVLILISSFEKRVVVLADSGINSKVDTHHWDEIVKSITTKIGENSFIEGLCNGIATCGKTLATYFPLHGEAKNELPNTLIVED